MPELHLIGHVHSSLVNLGEAPRQGDEGAPDAQVVLAAEYADGLSGIAAGDEVLLLTWLDRASRDVLSVHPRGDRDRPAQGVFTTRSPDRPNPIGLHRVVITAIEGSTLTVSNLEAIDGTPILDIKPVLGPVEGR